MRTSGITGVLYALAATVGSASAANMALKAPPPASPPPVSSWTGCHLGAHAGGGWGRTTFADPDTALFAPQGGSLSVDSHGALAGASLGCDYQAATLVIGAEASGSWADISGSQAVAYSTIGSNVTGTAQTKTEWLATATGRAGFSWDRVLLYGKGGVAFAGDKYGFVGEAVCTGLCIGPNPAPLNFSGNETRVGWTAGGGLEWAFQSHWSAKVEYDFYCFGADKVAFFNSAGTSFLSFAGTPAQVSQYIHTVVGGISYRF